MRLLRWISTRLRPLGRVRCLPQAFDLLLRLYSFLCAPEVFRAITALTHAVAGWEGVTLSSHRFGGRQFDLGTRELGHVHGNGVVDVLLDRSLQRQVVAGGRAVEHHTFPDSGWVSLQLSGPADVSAAVELLRLALHRGAARELGQARKKAEPQERPALTASGK